jgi:HEAT repeat protein
MKIATYFVLLLLTGGLVYGQTSTANSERAKDILEAALKDKNPDTRMHATQALSLASAREPWITRLETMIQDKDVQVQLAAIASLVDLKTDRTVPTLQKALASNVPEVTFAAAKALWILKQPAGEDALIAILSGEIKSSSGFLTRQKRDALRLMQTPKGMFLFAITTGAAFAPVPGAGAGAASVQGILNDPGVSGRAAAALLLTDDKDPRVLDALKDALSDKNWSVRAAAAHAIALRNEPSLAPNLIPLFEDKKDGVRVRAAAGYLRLNAIASDRTKKK